MVLWTNDVNRKQSSLQEENIMGKCEVCGPIHFDFSINDREVVITIFLLLDDFFFVLLNANMIQSIQRCSVSFKKNIYFRDLYRRFCLFDQIYLVFVKLTRRCMDCFTGLLKNI